MSPGNYIVTKLCGPWSYLSNNYTRRPQKAGTLFVRLNFICHNFIKYSPIFKLISLSESGEHL